jgi:hypothetical protein
VVFENWGVAMRDVELYRRLLGIEAPWEVQQVELSVSEQRLDVVVGHAKGGTLALPGDVGLLEHIDSQPLEQRGKARMRLSPRQQHLAHPVSRHRVWLNHSSFKVGGSSEARFHDECDLSKAVIGGELRETARLRLDHFYLTEWIPYGTRASAGRW